MANMDVTVSDLQQMTLHDIIGILHSRDEELSAISAEQGKSAYELAVEKGFSGSVVDWLVSLKGETGADGIVDYDTLITDLISKKDFLEALADNVETGLIAITGNINYNRENMIGFTKYSKGFIFNDRSKTVDMDTATVILGFIADNKTMEMIQ
jgi:hypothetical protein